MHSNPVPDPSLPQAHHHSSSNSEISVRRESDVESQLAGQLGQSVAEPAVLDTAEPRYCMGQVRIPDRVATGGFEIRDAFEDLRVMVGETVRHEVGALRREMNSKFEALESRFRGIRWTLGLIVVCWWRCWFSWSIRRTPRTLVALRSRYGGMLRPSHVPE